MNINTKKVEFSQVENEQVADDEDILELSERLINKNSEAYKELSK